MIPLDKHDLAFLYTLQNKDLIKYAIKVTKKGADLFPSNLRPHLAMMWSVLVKHVVKSKKEGHFLCLDKKAYVADCIEKLKVFDMLEENKAKLQHICTLYLEDTEADFNKGLEYLKQELDDSLQRSLNKAIYSSASFEEVKKLVASGTELKQDLVSAETKTLFVNPLLNASRYLKKVPKFPMGVKYFDKVTHGGMAEQEIALIAGLSGGGKSTITIECTCAQLLQNQRVAWFTYEQPFDQDLMQRVVAYISGYDLSLVRNMEYEDLPEDVITQFERITAKTADNLMATDFTTDEFIDKDDPDDDGSAYSIEKRLKIWYDQGKVPSYVFVDWLGAAVKSIATRKGTDIGQATNYIAIANDFITDLVKIAKKFKTRVIFFHQLEPALKKSPPSRKPTSVELQHIKSASNWVTYAMVIGKRDSNERCWYICDKCRTGFPSECVIELQGEKARFNLLEGFTPGRDGQFIDVAAIQDEIEDNSSDGYASII